MKIIRLFSVLILIGTLASCNLFKQEKLINNDADTLLIEDYTEPIIPVDTPEVVEEPQEEIVIEPPVANNRYFMVVGSFYEERNAERYANDLSNQGYESMIHYSPNGFYRVSAKGYEVYQEGVNEIDLFRNTITPNAWLFVKN